MEVQNNQNLGYKLLTTKEFNDFKETKIFEGNNLDKKDKFIHCCKNTDQINYVLNKLFNNSDNVWVLKIDLNKIPENNLKYEFAKNGQLFPHIYDRPIYWEDVIDQNMITVIHTINTNCNHNLFKS